MAYIALLMLLMPFNALAQSTSVTATVTVMSNPRDIVNECQRIVRNNEIIYEC